MVIVNSSQLLFPCSCQNISLATGNFSDSGFCEAQTPDWPVYDVVNTVFCPVACFLSRRCDLDSLLCLCSGLRCQRGELAAHQHRGRPRDLPGSRSDRGTAASLRKSLNSTRGSEPTNPVDTV